MNQESYKLMFTSHFAEDVQYWKREDPKIYRKIQSLVAAIAVNPFEGIGNPKHLNMEDLGYDAWSRRINQEHRIVYTVTEKQIIFLQCRYHYKI